MVDRHAFFKDEISHWLNSSNEEDCLMICAIKLRHSLEIVLVRQTVKWISAFRKMAEGTMPIYMSLSD